MSSLTMNFMEKIDSISNKEMNLEDNKKTKPLKPLKPFKQETKLTMNKASMR